MEPHGAGLILYTRKSGAQPRYLLLARGSYWSFPKGLRNKRSGGALENALSAALRETAEETGIQDVTIISDFQRDVVQRLPRPTKNCPAGVKLIRLFLARYDGDTSDVTLSNEHTRYSWDSVWDATTKLNSVFRVAISEADVIAKRN